MWQQIRQLGWILVQRGISMFSRQQSIYKRHGTSRSSYWLEEQVTPSYQFWQDHQRTLCEANDIEKPSTSTPSIPGTSSSNPYDEQIKELQLQLEEPCRVCMYTGVAVCTGLSVYFGNLAIDPTTLPKNQRFLWICSASSLVAGAYRFYLGWEERAMV